MGTEDEHTGSTASLSLAKAWLAACEHTHPPRSCPAPTKTLLPKRVLDVGHTSSDTVKIHESDWPQSDYYAALSHCWGEAPFLTTTSLNLTDHKTEIPWAALPQTFQDAIIVVRYLGLRYLWIDSLCIIQDLLNDWELQSANMSQIYSGAYVQIGAAAAGNASGGCFMPRKGWINRPCKLNLRNLSSSVMYARHAFNLSADGPLYRRAWALQEQILAQRSIVFAADGLHWRCCSLSANERYPEGWKTAPTEGFPALKLPLYPAMPSEYFDLDSILQSWYRDVKEYARRFLTVPTDRLPAIAGLASIMNSALGGDRYVAGLWLSDIHRGLLWSTFTSDEDPKWVRLRSKDHISSRPAHPPMMYVAPSFSWASRDKSAPNYDWVLGMTIGMNTRPLLRHLNPVCHLRGRNAYGEVASVWLELEGDLMELEWGHEDDYDTQLDDGYTKDVKCQTWLLAVMAMECDNAEDKQVFCLIVRERDLQWRPVPVQFYRIGLALLKQAHLLKHCVTQHLRLL